MVKTVKKARVLHYTRLDRLTRSKTLAYWPICKVQKMAKKARMLLYTRLYTGTFVRYKEIGLIS
jgi:hypothetical protein